jgi:hypothetical protein
MSKEYLVEVGRFAYEVNRQYCALLGESRPPWDDAPEEERYSVVLGVKNLESDPYLPPYDTQGRWMTQKLQDGWQYGPTRDVVAKTHPCMVAYEKLPVAQQAKFYLFNAAVIAGLRAFK